MKKLLLTILLVFLIAGQAFAICLGGTINVWPGTNTINQNSIIIVEGYGRSVDVIRKLNEKHKIYLRSGNSTIPLKVVKRYEGQFLVSQAILKPANKLIEGRSYTIHIDSLEGLVKEEFERAHFQWTVVKKNDSEIPKWSQSPTYINKSKISYGCGPASYVDFCVCIQDRSPVVVFSKLKELKTGRIAEYYVIPDTTILSIGHGMCGGEFEFEPGENYEISFSLMDASGNINDTLTKPIPFIGPMYKDSENVAEKTPCECPKIEEESDSTTMGIIFMSSLLVLIMTGVTLFVGNRRA